MDKKLIKLYEEMMSLYSEAHFISKEGFEATIYSKKASLKDFMDKAKEYTEFSLYRDVNNSTDNNSKLEKLKEMLEKYSKKNGCQ